MAHTYLPITSQRGMDFFASNHHINIVKAYVAHSPDLVTANNILWRRGYNLQLRKRILKTFKQYVNDATMANVPFSEITDDAAFSQSWYHELDDLELIRDPNTGWVIPESLESIIAGGIVTPPVATLEWVTPPPDTAYVLTDYKATWKGGKATYKTDIVGPVNLNPTDIGSGQPLELVMNVDGTNQPVGSYVWTIESADGQKITHTTLVKDITRDVAIFPKAGDESKTSTITNTGATQTITLGVGDTYTGHIRRVNADGTEQNGTGINSSITPVSSDTVASYVLTGTDIVITAKALGDVTYVLESGDHSAHKNIHVVVRKVSPVLTLDTAAMNLGETDISRGLFRAVPLPTGVDLSQVDKIHQFYRDTWNITSSDTSVMTIQTTPTVAIVWGSSVADGASAELVFDYKEDLGNQIQRFTIVKHPSP